MLLSASNGYDMAVVAFYDFYRGSTPESAHVGMVDGQDNVLKFVVFLKTFDDQPYGGCFVCVDMSGVVTCILMIVEGLDDFLDGSLSRSWSGIPEHSRLQPFRCNIR